MNENHSAPNGGDRCDSGEVPPGATATEPPESVDPVGDSAKPATGEWDRLLKLCGELYGHCLHYLSVQTDTAKLGVRSLCLAVAGAVLTYVSFASLSVMALWFLISGTAEGLGGLFGDRPWAGKLGAGLLFLGGLRIAIAVVMARWTRSSREAMVSKYEQKQERK